MPWRPLRPGEFDHERIWPGVTLLAGLLLFGWYRWGAGYPVCTFKHLTGIPCPTCGATRAALRLLRGDLPGAFLFNPLVTLGFFAVIGYHLYALTVTLFRLPRWRPTNTSPGGFSAAILLMGAALLAANWFWVIRRGL